MFVGIVAELDGIFDFSHSKPYLGNAVCGKRVMLMKIAYKNIRSYLPLDTPYEQALGCNFLKTDGRLVRTRKGEEVL